MNEDADTQRHYTLYAYEYVIKNGKKEISMSSLSFIEDFAVRL